MGQALSKWIEGSLAALNGIEAERDRQAALLDEACRQAASKRDAISELDRQLAKLTEQRKQHAAQLAALDQEIEIGTKSLEGLDEDLQAMAAALDKVGSRPDPPAKPAKPAPAAPPPVVVGPPAAPAAVARVNVKKKTDLGMGPKVSPTKTVVPGEAPSTTQRAPKADPIPDPDVAETAERDLFPALDDAYEQPAPKRSRWRVAAAVMVILGVVIGGGGYAAVQTEAGAKVFESVRAQVRSVF